MNNGGLNRLGERIYALTTLLEYMIAQQLDGILEVANELEECNTKLDIWLNSLYMSPHFSSVDSKHIH